MEANLASMEQIKNMPNYNVMGVAKHETSVKYLSVDLGDQYKSKCNIGRSYENACWSL